MRATICGTAVLLCSSLAGCGGAGGDSSSNTPPDFSLSTTQLSFSTTQGGAAPPSQTFTVTATGGTYGAAGGTIYISTGISGDAVARADVSNCMGSTCQVVVLPASQLSPGTHTATITVTACTNFQCATPVGTPKTVTATYVVTPGPQLSSTASLVFVAAANAAFTAQTLNLTSSVSGAAWTATVTYEAGSPGWLNVPASGSGNTALTIQPSALPAGGYRARIDFAPTATGTATSTEVFASARAQGVRFVMPYVAISNTTAEVAISGQGFASLSAPVVNFGSVAGTAVQVVSDTEIKVHNPALSAGRYNVTVSSAGQAMPGSPTFVVVDAPTYTYTAFPRTSSNLNGSFVFGRIVYDAERQAIYFLENSEFMPMTDQIERYRFVNGAWVSDPPLAFPIPPSGGFDTFSAITLTPDGQQLLKSNIVTVSHIDPVAWQVTKSVDGSAALGANADLLEGAMSNDGSFILQADLHGGALNSIVRYDSVDQAFYPLTQPPVLQNPPYRFALGSAEGDHVGFYAYGSSATPVYDYDAGTGTSSQNPNLSTVDPAFVSYSRDGKRVLLQVANGLSPSLIVPSVQPNTTYDIYPLPIQMAAGVLSPDGNRIYAYDASGGMLYTLDAHAPSSGFPQIGTGVPVPDAPGLGHQMIITPDGGTLILCGNDHLIIMPAP